MAGFKTHITTSSLLGVGYGAVAFTNYHVPLPACLIGAGLCSVGGMLPDLDSDSGVPRRESIHFASAAIPLLMLHRFEHWGMSHDMMAAAGMLLYFMIRFVGGAVLNRVTVHRGMFHSLPACLIAGEIVYLVCESQSDTERYFKAAGVMLGFMSHLVLDEIWSIDMQHGRPRLKSSFGTAIKFWGQEWFPNLATYAIVGGLWFVAVEDPTLIEQHLQPTATQVDHVADRAPADPPH